jgi:hypothetical protein
MKHILLLGAGFSRNYGGWLADELTADLMGRVSDDAELLKQLRHQNGFEAALEEVRALYQRNPNQTWAERLRKLQDAIGGAFGEMNAAFDERGNMEFQEDRNYWVQTFLARFDLIFTLNQDLLLERLYHPENVNQQSGRGWQGTDAPGMTFVPRTSDEDEMWVPDVGASASNPRPGLQPIVKLHGSVKWLDISDPSRVAQPMLIMGTNKAADIPRSPVLSRYLKMFEDELTRPKTRLMVIGYSFGDMHINNAIVNAGTSLETFIVDPVGIKVLETLNTTKKREVPAFIQVVTPIEQITVIGLSRRYLSETFGNDRLAWRQLMRFFRV